MTDTTTVDDDAADVDEELPELVDERAARAATAPRRTRRSKTRLLLPLLLPLLVDRRSVALLALNVSRVFLAGDSNSALGDRHRHHAGDPRAARR